MLDPALRGLSGPQPTPEPSGLGGRGLHASPSARGKMGMSLLRDNFSALQAEFAAWQGSQSPCQPVAPLSKAASAELPSSAGAAEAAHAAAAAGGFLGGASKRTPSRQPKRVKSAGGEPQVRS